VFSLPRFNLKEIEYVIILWDIDGFLERKNVKIAKKAYNQY